MSPSSLGEEEEDSASSSTSIAEMSTMSTSGSLPRDFFDGETDTDERCRRGVEIAAKSVACGGAIAGCRRTVIDRVDGVGGSTGADGSATDSDWMGGSNFLRFVGDIGVDGARVSVAGKRPTSGFLVSLDGSSLRTFFFEGDLVGDGKTCVGLTGDVDEELAWSLCIAAHSSSRSHFRSLHFVLRMLIT